jgi:hypothetical protein
MKSMKSNRLILLLLFIFSGWSRVMAQDDTSYVTRCASYELDSYKARRDPSWLLKRARMDSLILQYTRNQSQRRVSAYELIRIPVVVHVIHSQNDNNVGGAGNSNISEEQIRSQIAVLNEDFRRIVGTPGFNTNPVGADSFIEFYLADSDPNGAPTNGITRHRYLKKTTFDPYSDDQLLSSIAYWPSDKYLNIWICRLSASNLAIAQFPATDKVEGLDTSSEPSAQTDGVIVDFRYFGRKTGAITSRIYNLGRTTTHEVGHWLGLIHTWGDTYCGTDYCPDTPTAEGSNQTTVCNPRYSNCFGVRTLNMIENYMDYSPDSCMNVFTKDQVARMRAVLALSPRRARLVEFSKLGNLAPTDNLTVNLYPNPAVKDMYLEIQFPDFQDVTYTIFDLTGRMVQKVRYPQIFSRRLILDVSILPPGIYLLKVEANNETKTIRFLVN